jgi:isopenicillin N synthase-like dioxygenase
MVQVLTPYREWVDVPAGPGLVTIIPGYTLRYLTAGAVNPTPHRVVRPLSSAG